MVIIKTTKTTYNIPPEPFKAIVERARYGLKDAGQWDHKSLGEFLDNEEDNREEGLDFCITCHKGKHPLKDPKKRSIAVYCGYKSGIKTGNNGAEENICYRYDTFLKYALSKSWLGKFKVK